jgi:hypothetical protein
MAKSRENPHKGDARDVGARRGGHDLFRRPPRGRHPSQFADPLQRQSHLRKKIRRKTIALKGG